MTNRPNLVASEIESPVDPREGPAQTAAEEKPAETAHEMDAVLDEDLTHRARSLCDDQEAATSFVGPAVFNHTHIHGNVVGGDYVAGGVDAPEAPRVRTNRILRLEITKMWHVYTDPPQHEAAMAKLSDHNVVVLVGPPHSGKWTGALRLLAEKHDTAMFQMLQCDTSALEEFEFDREAGYVIDTIDPAQAERLDRNVMDDLETRLRAVDSHLVVTVDSRWARLAGIGRYRVDWSGIGDRGLMFRRHLDWYADADVAPTLVEALTTDETVNASVATCGRPSDVDHLANLLVRVDLESVDLQRFLEGLSAADAEEWFGEHVDPTDRVYMIVFAVLSGVSYRVAADLAAELAERVHPADPDSEQVGRSAFTRRRSEVLAATQSRVVSGHENSEFGRTRIEQLVLDESVDRAGVLRFVWQEFDGVRGPLLEWLHDLGGHPAAAVRRRAAAAVGELSKYEFGELYRSVVRPWAVADSRVTRDAAALALGIPAWDGELAPQVVGVLHHWATLRTSPRLQSTAAAAFGGLVGLRFPDVAARELRTIVDGSAPFVFHAVVRALTTLFEAGTPDDDYRGIVLDTLVEWSDDSSASEAFAALMAFVAIASGSRVQPQAPAASWPTLLWLLESGHETTDQIVELWRRSLNDKLLRPEALQSLRRWVTLADDKPDARASVQALIVRLGGNGSERELSRLRAHLRRWADSEEKGSVTAAECLTAIA